MFTGIVAVKGKVVSLQRNPFGMRLIVDRANWNTGAYKIAPGDSIAVSGVCLTVVESNGVTLSFDVIAETLEKTSLGQRVEGGAVNLEHALTAATPMGGHFVQGHVDGVGIVTDVTASAEEWRVRVKPPAELTDYIVPKGSITIDGVSLTLASVGRDNFEVALIPTTLDITTLGTAKAGDRVNLEADIVTKTIIHWLRRQTQAQTEGQAGRPVTMDLLRKAGFNA